MFDPVTITAACLGSLCCALAVVAFVIGLVWLAKRGRSADSDSADAASAGAQATDALQSPSPAASSGPTTDPSAAPVDLDEPTAKLPREELPSPPKPRVERPHGGPRPLGGAPDPSSTQPHPPPPGKARPSSRSTPPAPAPVPDPASIEPQRTLAPHPDDLVDFGDELDEDKTTLIPDRQAMRRNLKADSLSDED